MPDKTVLVVEDDPLLRADTASMFEEAGFDVVELESADNALGYIWEQADHVAAVFTDVQMPGDMDGFELAQVIAEQWPEIAVLVTSGDMDKPRDFPAGARFMAKPWLPLDVLTAVGDAVTRH